MAESSKGEKSGGMRIDPSLVRELAELLHANELTEIEVEDGDRRIRVKREPPAIVAGAPAAPVAAAPALSGPPVHAKEDIGGAPAEEEVAGNTVKSPMVGTAYLGPQPGAAPFVAIGDTVREGQTLFIIEAMKVMNQIPAPRAGRVVQILIADATPVEFGQILAVLE
jgi:acetyl-CoA carboxylase biotin carboxyl carrier protein